MTAIIVAVGAASFRCSGNGDQRQAVEQASQQETEARVEAEPAQSEGDPEVQQAAQEDPEAVPPSIEGIQAGEMPNGQDAPAAEQEQTRDQGGQAQSDPAFNIANRLHAAARLTILHGILADGNPLTDPIAWAKAGVAASRVGEICNNFDIDEGLDAACDQLLIAIETPFGSVAPILAAAATELRQVLPRRELAELDYAAAWDADLSHYRTDIRLIQVVSALIMPMRMCDTAEDWCTASIYGDELMAFLGWRLSLRADIGPESDASAMISLGATNDLAEHITELTSETSPYARRLKARSILRELELLGFSW